MVAGVLHKLGVDMGENAERGSERNPAGFFEDEGIVDISRRILKRAEDGVSMADLEKEFGSEIRKAIKKREKEQWGFKDVNQIQTHPLFRKKLKNPSYLVVYRNPLSTAQSMCDWHDSQLLPTLKRVLDEFQMIQNYIEVTLAGDSVMILSYERILEQLETTVDDIIHFLGLSPTEEQRKNAIEHINPELKHQ